MSLVSFSNFAELKIVLGTITDVCLVEDADRLLRLVVEVGEDKPRQVISGIREYFNNEKNLVGKQCVFLINLESRIIKGYESQGMILALNHDADFSLLVPDKSGLPDGTQVK